MNEIIKAFYNYFKESTGLDFWTVPASRSNHHNWKGGLFDHCDEMLVTAAVMTKENPEVDDFIVEMAIWLHDAHKIFDYAMTETFFSHPDYPADFVKRNEIVSTKQDYPICTGTTKTLLMIAEYNANCSDNMCIEVSDKLVNAISMAEGGYSHFAYGRGIGHLEMTKEAAIVHACDILSSHVLGSSKC